MKKLFTLTALLFGMMSSAMADDIKIATYGNASGTSRTVTVALNREANYVACQFDLTLPEGTTVKSITPKAPLKNGGVVDLSKAGGNANESTDFVVDFNQVGTTCKVIAYNLGNVAIGGASGDVLMTVELETTNAVDFDDVSVATNDITFVKSGDLTAATMANVADGNGEAGKSVKKLWGDVNGDGKVNATDIDASISAAASGNSTGLDHFATKTGIEGAFKATDIDNVIEFAK